MPDDASPSEPGHDCARCERLADFRLHYRSAEPEWHNAPVASFGSNKASLLIVGLAPGLKGANRTGRPFTGDFAGDLLYGTLLASGFARGNYAADPSDGLELIDCRITNAVRCVPPQNKPTPQEIRNCRSFLSNTIDDMRRLKVIVALGRIAHDTVLTTFGLRKAAHPFAHGARHAAKPGLVLFDSYHCSRYNTNTGVLTEDMFRSLFKDVRRTLDGH